MILIKIVQILVGENARRFNAPTINEVSIVMISDQLKNEFIKICGEIMNSND